MKHTKKFLTQRIHAKRRLEERYNITDSFLPKDCSAWIRSNKCNLPKNVTVTFLERKTNRVSKWKITKSEKVFIVLYDNKRKNIVTFLPKPEEENV